MPAINGTVQFLSIKEMAKPDNYENTHRASIKIGDKWYSYGTIKKDKVNIKTGDSWTELAKGMEVEFMYDQNGDFANIKKKTFSITDASGAEPPAPVQQSSVQGQGTQGGSKNSFVNPAEIGQCMNLAAHIGGYTTHDMLNPEKVCEAIQWYKRSRQMFTSLYEGVDMEKTLPKESKPQKEAPEPENYDDDDV